MSNRPYIFVRAGGLALFILLALMPFHLRAAGDTQPHRDLLIFEMSPTMKKDLPATKEALAKLFASNMDNEIHPGDDIAVWTADDGLHSATDLISSWEPEEAAIYTGKVWEFLSKQKYTRHASLAPVNPSLDRVMRKCQHLTVLIFCDSQARLEGTPFDAGVNEIITNTAAKFRGGPIPLVVILRAYDGEYIGSSVNRTMPFNFPKFPAPPKPTPPPVVSAAPPVPVPPKRIEGPIVTPIPAMIIVGTNAGTNISILTNAPPRPVPAPRTPPPAIAAPPTKSVATNAAAEPAATVPPTKVAVAPPVSAPIPNSAETVPATPQVAPISSPKPSSAPPTAVVQSNNAVTVAAAQQGGHSFALVPLIIGVGALATALVIVARILSVRRSRSSLITSSMHGDQHQPPR